ncbi:MAG: MATE family efflux transporter [Rhodobacteraceae bacterium]|nr:MATE family efflux transporter [Paracoccaceae bacterium]
MADAATITHPRVLTIAVPVVISNITTPILGAVDTGVVGQTGTAVPIGAVGIGAVIIAAVYWFFGFLRMGTTGLAAQAIGRADAEELAALLTRVLLIGGAGGMVIFLLQIPITRVAFRLSPASEEVEQLAHTYLTIRFLSAPAAVAMFGLTGWLIARERTAAVLIIQLWINGLNIMLDLIFVLGLDRGVDGVATATVIAEWTGLMLGLWLVRRGFADGHWRVWARVFDRARLWRMAQLNGDILIRSLLLQTALLSFVFFGAGLGDVTLAANQVLVQFLMFASYALDGFAFAAEALVGQAVGARARGTLRRAVSINAQWTLVAMLVLCALTWVFGGHVIAVMTPAPDIRAEAAVYLPWLIAAPILCGPSFLLDGIFIGATRGRDLRNMMALSFAAYGAALGLLTGPFGNHGLWAAFMVFFVARAVTLMARYPVLVSDLGR